MRNRKLLFFILAICLSSMLMAQRKDRSVNYVKNRLPLVENPYLELPLGNIKPDGWLKEMLVRQKNGATGHLDEIYPLVMGNRNGWLGGDGDQWERGPYWIDGLLPLAYILNDSELKVKVKPWVEWTLNSQRPDGYFGPSRDYPDEAGLQRNNCGDWWPKMVMLKILKQYYSATGDQRVISFMTSYFHYQLKELPNHPLDHWTFWARYRGGDNLQVVYWLYNITGDKLLLDLADILHQQTYDFADMFLNTDMISTQGDLHCVNLAQGMKEPLIYYQHHPEKKYAEAVKKGFTDIRKYMGQPQGMFGGDENIRNSNPINGSELCSAVEMMFTLESILPITGDAAYADHLEKIAFNALPTQITDDFMARQYFQQPNQVMITRQRRNFNVDHKGTDVCFGLLTGYPCCTSNMHQGWPKFTQNLWYATPDGGLAALIYAPNHVKAEIAGGTEVTIEEKTSYPFEEKITFIVSLEKVPVNFSLHFRIPSWCRQASVTINGNEVSRCKGDTILVVRREWNNGDKVELELPMRIALANWYENSVAVERGPLTYALKIGEKWENVINDKDPVRFGTSYYEVRPTTPWNYGLLDLPEDKIQEMFTFVKKDTMTSYPWNLENVPVELRTKAKRLINWKLYNETAGPLPYSIQWGWETEPELEEITLIPYGCSTLRISEFPRVIYDSRE
jgi:DUF1680 family protein